MSFKLALAALSVALAPPAHACNGAVFFDAILPTIPQHIPDGASIYEVTPGEVEEGRVWSVNIVRIIRGYAPQNTIKLPLYGGGDCRTAHFPKTGKSYVVAYPSYVDQKSFNVIFFNLNTFEIWSHSLFHDR